MQENTMSESTLKERVADLEASMTSLANASNDMGARLSVLESKVSNTNPIPNPVPSNPPSVHPTLLSRIEALEAHVKHAIQFLK